MHPIHRSIPVLVSSLLLSSALPGLAETRPTEAAESSGDTVVSEQKPLPEQPSSVSPQDGLSHSAMDHLSPTPVRQWLSQNQASTIAADLLPDTQKSVPAGAAVTDLAQAQPGDADNLAAAQPEAEVNTGQDPTRPITRFDLRIKYQDLSDLDLPPFRDQDLRAWIFTLRADKPFPLGGGYTLSTRVDVPLIVNNVPSLDNLDGDTEFGIADSLVQLLLIMPHQGRWTFAAGTQVLFPTATQDQFGTGKWQLAPIVAAKYDSSNLIPRSWMALILKNRFSFAGDSDRSDTNRFSIQPILNINLPDFWFVTFAPEIAYDWEQGGWFVPFDITVGKLFNRKVVTSLEMKIPIYDQLDSPNFEIEGRIGFFF